MQLEHQYANSVHTSPREDTITVTCLLSIRYLCAYLVLPNSGLRSVWHKTSKIPAQTRLSWPHSLPPSLPPAGMPRVSPSCLEFSLHRSSPFCFGLRLFLHPSAVLVSDVFVGRFTVQTSARHVHLRGFRIRQMCCCFW